MSRFYRHEASSSDPMHEHYQIDDTSQIISPGLVVFRDLVERNIERMVEMAGDASRLRPHCKTHKMREVVRLQMDSGITKHKCATFAEAEMLADTGVNDIFLAYNIVGPNLGRAVEFVETFSHVTLSVTADHAEPIRRLGEAMSRAGRTIDVLLDIDTGQHRTGIAAGAPATELYGRIVEAAGLNPGGLHIYDGQNHQTDVGERRVAVDACWSQAIGLHDQLLAEGWPVPRIVAGGTASFPLYAEKNHPALELSPGTLVFHDVGYRETLPDLNFVPAALILTRVVSCPTSERITVDLGYKSCAADEPMGRRVEFPDLPDAVQVLQDEEHLVLQTNRASEFAPGDELLAIPRHICPTSALHKEAHVVSGGKVVDRWEVAARDRWLTI